VELLTILVPILLADVLNPVLLGAVFGERADGPLGRLNGGMDRASAVLVPLLLLAIGAFFLADAAWYALRGESLVAL
jgi:hypothetical protein